MQVIASKCQGNNVGFYGWHCFQRQVKTPLGAVLSGEVPLRRPRAWPAAFPVTPPTTETETVGEDEKPSIW